MLLGIEVPLCSRPNELEALYWLKKHWRPPFAPVCGLHANWIVNLPEPVVCESALPTTTGLHLVETDQPSEAHTTLGFTAPSSAVLPARFTHVVALPL
jgi:hypothetical protein